MNPTPPTNETADFLRGWSARAQADGTAPVVPPAPVIPTVPLTADFGAVLAGSQDNSTIHLAAGGDYILSGPAAITANGVKLLGGAGSRIVRRSVPGSTTGILIAGDNIEISGIEFDSDKPLGKQGASGWNNKVGINALRLRGKGAYVHGCTGRNIDDLCFVESTAVGTRIIGNRATNELRGDAVYFEHVTDLIIENNTIAGSQLEHGIRGDTGDGQTPPRRITIRNNTVGSNCGKESIAIRWGWDVLVTGNTLLAWARVSQGPSNPPAPNKCCGSVQFVGNSFGVGAYLTINPYTPGCAAKGNTFALDSSHVAINVQGPAAELFVGGNTKLPTPAGTKVKPLIHSYGQVVLTGGDAKDVNAS